MGFTLNRVIQELIDAIEYDQSIEGIIPLDLRGMSTGDLIQVYACYITYGKDQKKIELCRKKWNELMKGDIIL